MNVTKRSYNSLGYVHKFLQTRITYYRMSDPSPGCRELVSYHSCYLFYSLPSLLPNAFFAEQTKKNGTTNKCLYSELMRQKGSVLFSGSVHEEENESEQLGIDNDVGNELNEPNTATLTGGNADSNNGITNLNDDFMEEDGDKAIAELDIEEVINNDSLSISNFVDKKLAEHLHKLKFLGRFIGLAICQGHFLNLHLSKSLVKQVSVLVHCINIGILLLGI